MKMLLQFLRHTKLHISFIVISNNFKEIIISMMIVPIEMQK